MNSSSRDSAKEAPGRTVLVVEDDEEMLSMISRALAAGGFNVVWARNGDDALTILERRGSSVDVLLTDVVLPRMAGPMLARRVSRTHPHIAAVYVSAYDTETIRSNGVDPDRDAFLAKPYDPADLLRLVREIADR